MHCLPMHPHPPPPSWLCRARVQTTGRILQLCAQRPSHSPSETAPINLASCQNDTVATAVCRKEQAFCFGRGTTVAKLKVREALRLDDPNCSARLRVENLALTVSSEPAGTGNRAARAATLRNMQGERCPKTFPSTIPLWT